MKNGARGDPGPPNKEQNVANWSKWDLIGCDL